MEKIGIYIHIPFCKRKCFYCHFVKYPYDTELVEKYIHTLCKEIPLRAKPHYTVDTVYIGGGSPSLLNETHLSAIMESLQGHFKIQETRDLECTVEVNPEDVTISKLEFYRKLGVNRLSIGTQSFMPEDLEYLKRPHTVRQSKEAVEMALNAGFSNISIDFITGLPTQTKKSLRENFSFLRGFDIPHVSAYILEEVEEGEEKDLRDNRLYFLTRSILREYGYCQYEVSNFSKPGFFSRHNMKYWRNELYIGVGLSASGFENDMDYKNAAVFAEYFEKIERGILPHAEENGVNKNLRQIVVGLRLIEGIPAHCFDSYAQEVEFLLANKVLIRKGENIGLNPRKLLLLNEVLTYF